MLYIYINKIPHRKQLSLYLQVGIAPLKVKGLGAQIWSGHLQANNLGILGHGLKLEGYITLW